MRLPKKLVWFSCGAPSACCGQLAIEEYGPDQVELCYCNTLAYEHPDNPRFMRDVESWLGVSITILKSNEFTDIYDVFDKTGWLVGPRGARCTVELKKKVREAYQVVGDTHIFGLTLEEGDRAERLKANHFDLDIDLILIRKGYTREDCLGIIRNAGIQLPAMYRLGYNNNNCVGCVKGGIGYWNKIRREFPEAFQRMARQERKMRSKIHDCYLDELDPNRGNHKTEHSFECGVMCQMPLNLEKPI